MGLLEVSSRMPCPVCGHKRACKRITDDSTGAITKVVICVHSGKGRNLLGTETADGYNYRYVRTSDSGEWNTYIRCSGPDTVEKSIRKGEWARNPEIDKNPPRSNKELDPVNRFILGSLRLTERDYTYLRSGRGYSEEMIKEYGFASFPEKDYLYRKYHNRTGSPNPSRETIAREVIRRFGKEGIPGLFTDKNGNPTFAGSSGILIPVFDADGYVYRLRVRRDFLDLDRDLYIEKDKATYVYEGKRYVANYSGVFFYEGSELKKDTDEAKGKYKVLSADFGDGCKGGAPSSVYRHDNDSAKNIVITEGEMKAMIINRHYGFPAVSLPGVGQYMGAMPFIEKLAENGARRALVAYDADKNTNMDVANALANLEEQLLLRGYSVFELDWPAEYKGLDDLIIAGKADSVTFHSVKRRDE